MKTISECPVCKSSDLEQEFISPERNRRIGGEHSSYPSSLNGCSCNSCGTKLKFDKKGKCPNCKGSGRFTSITSIGGIEQHSTSYGCTTCEGTGKI